jgi:hypothetical protein
VGETAPRHAQRTSPAASGFKNNGLRFMVCPLELSEWNRIIGIACLYRSNVVFTQKNSLLGSRKLK